MTAFLFQVAIMKGLHLVSSQNVGNAEHEKYF
jgi:hypothetical protein